MAESTVTFSVDLSDPATAYPDLATVGQVYDIGINGVGYMLRKHVEGDNTDALTEWRYKRESVPLEPQRFATTETPFAQQIQHYAYTKFADWTAGTGQQWLERGDLSADNAFFDSDGVDPFTPFQLTLLKATSVAVSSVYSASRAVNVGGTLYVQTGAKQLTYITSPSGSGTAVSIAAATTIVDLASDGQFWYAAAGTAGTFRGTTADPGAKWDTLAGATDVQVVAFAGQRICIGYKSGGSSTPNTWSTLTSAGAEEVAGGRLILPTGWSVTKTTSGSGQCWFGAYCGDKGLIYRWQIGSTSAPAVAYELPAGEIPVDLAWYQGQVFIRAARALPSGGRQCVIYRAPVDGAGNLSPYVNVELGTTADTVDNAVGAWGTFGNKVFFSWVGLDNATSGIGSIYLPTGGVAKWHKAASGGAGAAVRSIVSFQGRLAFCVDGVGLVMEQTSYRTAGWLKSSLIDKDSVVEKVWDDITVMAKPIVAGESVSIDYTLDQGNTFTSLAGVTLSTAGSKRSEALLNKKADALGIRINLAGPGTSTPTLAQVAVQVHQFGLSDSMIQLPINCGDLVADLRGTALPENGPGAGAARARALEALVYTRIKFQDLDYQSTLTSYIYEVVQVEVDSLEIYDRSRGSQSIQQVALVTLRKLVR